MKVQCGSRGGGPAPWGMDLLQRFTNGAYQPNQEDFPESAGANRGPRALRSVTCACRKPSTLALIRWSNIWTGPAKSRVHEEDWNGISLKIADPNNCDNMLLETARLLLVRDSASKPWIEIVMKKSFNNFQLGFCTRTHTHTQGWTRAQFLRAPIYLALASLAQSEVCCTPSEFRRGETPHTPRQALKNGAMVIAFA